MITVTPSGNGWYVEGDRYRVYVTKSGITQMYLKLTGAPGTNVLYGPGIVWHEAWGQTTNTVQLTNPDSTIALVEENAVRARFSVEGFFEPGSGGTKYGTGSATLVFYADRFCVDTVARFTTSLGTGMRIRPLVLNYAAGTARPDYLYDTDGAGGFAWTNAAGGWAAVASNVSGPLSVETAHLQGAGPGGLVAVTLKNGEGLGTLDLWDTLAVGTYLGVRAQKTDAAVGQRYRAASVFNFATVAQIQYLSDEEAVAFRDDCLRPDPLSGAANAGVIFTGWKVTTGEGDENADGWNERETAYAVCPSTLAGYLDLRLDDRRGGTNAVTFLRPVFRITNWVSARIPEVYRWNGASWDQLGYGTGFLATSDADEAGAGPQTRIVQILSDLTGEGAEGPRFKFVEVFDEEPTLGDWGMEVRGAAVDMAAAKVSLRRLANSWRRGRSLEFAEAAAHTAGTWTEGDAVELAFRGETVFAGNVTERFLVGAPGAEEVIYRCRDLRARAERVNVADPASGRPRLVFNAAADDPEHNGERSGFTVGGIIEWLFDEYSEALRAAGAVSDTGEPYAAAEIADFDAVPPKTTFSNLNFDEALEAVLSYEPEVVFHIDPSSRTYRFLRLPALEARTAVYNGAAKPLSAMLRPTVEGRFTAYRIVGEGERTTRAAYLSEGELEEYWGGRATTTAAVEAGSNVTIPVTGTMFFAPGDSAQIGEGAGGETVTIDGVTAGASIRADLTKAHAAGTLVTNKAYLEAHWTIDKAFQAADSDAGTATGAGASSLIDAGKNWGADRWVGGEVTLDKGWVIQKRTVVDSGATTLYVDRAWSWAPEEGDEYEIAKGVSRYRYVYSRYRVADEDKRHIAETVEDPASLPPLPGLALVSHLPRVWRKMPGAGWVVVPVVFEYASGVVTTVRPAADGNRGVEGAATAAPDMRLDYSYIGAGCSARFPESGYTGTAHVSAGVARERLRYEADFRTPASVAQYEALAEKLVWPLADVAWRGELVLGVIDVEWLALEHRLNVAAVSDAGAAVPTGIEELGGLVSQAEIDFADGTTRIGLAGPEELAAQGDWFLRLSGTASSWQQGGGGGADGADGSGGSGGGTTVTITINEISEIVGGGEGSVGSGLVTSVSAGGANGIIVVSPDVGDVVVSHADYEAGNLTPCGYAPRWQ